MQSYTTTTITSVQTVSEPGRTTTTTETKTISATPSVSSTATARNPSLESPRDEQSGQQEGEDGDTEDNIADDDTDRETTSFPTSSERELPSIDNFATAPSQAEMTQSDLALDSTNPETDGVEPSGDDEQLDQTRTIEEQQADISITPLTQSVDLPPEQSAALQDSSDVSDGQDNTNLNGTEHSSATTTSEENTLNEGSADVNPESSEQVNELLMGELSLDAEEPNANEAENDEINDNEISSVVQPVSEILEDEPSDADEGPDLIQTEADESDETQNTSPPQPVTETPEEEPSDEDEDPESGASEIGQGNQLSENPTPELGDNE